MTEGNVVKFPFKELIVKKNVSQLVEKEEILNLDNIGDIAKPVEVGVEDIKSQFQPFSMEQIDKIKTESFKNGVIDATAKLNESHISEKTEILNNLNALKEKLEFMEISKSKFAAELIEVASSLAIGIAKKIIGENVDIHNVKVLEFFKETVMKLISQDCLHISLNSKAAAEFDSRLREVAKAANFTGEIKIIVNDNFSAGECEVFWSNGSARYSAVDIISKIDSIFQENGVTKAVVNESNPDAQNEESSVVGTDILPKNE